MSIVQTLRRLLLCISLLSLLLLLILIFSGITLFFKARHILPGQLSCEKISVQLSGLVHVEGLRYENGPLKVSLSNADLNCDIISLFTQHFKVPNLHFEGLELHLPPNQHSLISMEPLVLTDVKLPFKINFLDLIGQNINIIPLGCNPIKIESINLRVYSSETDSFHIETLDIKSPLIGVQLKGYLDFTDTYPLKIDIAWQAPLTGYRTLRGHCEINGKLRDKIKLTNVINDIADLEIYITVSKTLTTVNWSATANLDIVGLRPFIPDSVGKQLNAQLHGYGTMKEFYLDREIHTITPAVGAATVHCTAEGEFQLIGGAFNQFRSHGKINTNLPQIGPFNVQFSVFGDINQITFDKIRITSPEKSLNLVAEASLEIAKKLKFHINGEWRSPLALPVRGTTKIESSNGKFSIEGNPREYRFQLVAADLQGPNIPKGNWEVTGQGSNRAVRDVKIVGRILEGEIQASTDATWDPEIVWSATVSGNGINPGVYYKEAQGKLDFRLRTDGSFENTNLHANLSLGGLRGILRGLRVIGNADVSIHNQNVKIRNLLLSVGDNYLEAIGDLNERWDLSWKLNVQQLQSLIPGLDGVITSAGSISGPRTQPFIATKFTSKNLRQGSNQIQQLRVEARIDSSSVGRSQLKVSGNGLTIGGKKWQILRLDSTGTVANHELAVELIGDSSRVLLNLIGGLQTSQMLWQGRIMRLKAKDTNLGNWSMEEPAIIRVSGNEVVIDAIRMSSTIPLLCKQYKWQQQYSNFKAIQNNGVSPQNAGRSPFYIFCESYSSLRLDINKRTVNLQVRLNIAQTGYLQANLQIKEPLGAAVLNGKIDASTTDLEIVPTLLPQITEIAGRIWANLSLSGTLTKPIAQGTMRVENVGITIPDMGLKLYDIQLTATSCRGQWPFQFFGSVQSAVGKLQLAGKLDPVKRSINLKIKGEDFQVVKNTDLQIQISPDLVIDYTPQLIQITGIVNIPHAILRIGGQNLGTVNFSSDAIIIKNRDGKALQSEKNRDIAILSDMRLVLGQDVYLETHAFRGKVQGDLQIVENSELATRGTGNIDIVAGKYRVYGKEIDIQSGQLLFSNSPLDNPVLDLQIVRKERDIISGDEIMACAQIRGTMKKTMLKFLSTPKMSDREILAYLLLGHSPGVAGTETAILLEAASALGFGKGVPGGKDLGNAVGLDSLGLGNTSHGGTSFMLGKYLTPKLYVGYGIGLLNSVNTFFLKYRLTEYLILESATNSIATGGDIIYSIER